MSYCTKLTVQIDLICSQNVVKLCKDQTEMKFFKVLSFHSSDMLQSWKTPNISTQDKIRVIQQPFIDLRSIEHKQTREISELVDDLIVEPKGAGLLSIFTYCYIYVL